MKNNACSKEELLVSLASKGDAAAFYTLALPYFETEYLNLRHNGSTHTDAVEKILPDSSALFKKIIGNKPADFNEWFKNNSEISTPEFDEVAIVDIDKDMVSQQNHFLQEIQLHLLRTASEFNNKKRKKFLEFLRNPRTKMITGVSATILLFLILFLLLHITGSTVLIRFKHAEKEFSFVIGPSTQKEPASKSGLISAAPKPDSTTIDSTAKDSAGSVVAEEKKAEPPPVKKVYRPKPVIAEQPRISQFPPAQGLQPPSLPAETPAPVAEEPATPAISSGTSAHSTPPENSSNY